MHQYIGLGQLIQSRLFVALFVLCLGGPRVWAQQAESQTESETTPANTSEKIKFVGKAFDESGERFLYTEFHSLTKEGSKVVRAVTTYKDKSGKKLGSFKTNYSKDAFAPDAVLNDIVANRVTAAKRRGQKLTLSSNDKKKTINVPSNKPLVIGQGLHYFVVANFSKLLKGKKIKFALGVPDRQATYDFRVSKLKNVPKGKVRLRIEIDSWVKRRLVDPIDVDYSLDGKLTRYKGISNLVNESGKRPTVIIYY